jgi:hypothetical protein
MGIRTAMATGIRMITGINYPADKYYIFYSCLRPKNAGCGHIYILNEVFF